MGLRRLLGVGLAAFLSTQSYASAKSPSLYERILSRTKDSQVVMFGEEHGTYRKDNDFVIALLPKLKSQGFDYLALEFPMRNSDYLSPAMIWLLDYADGKVDRKDMPGAYAAEIVYRANGWPDLSKKQDLST